jgi:hypothetical protein
MSEETAPGRKPSVDDAVPGARPPESRKGSTPPGAPKSSGAPMAPIEIAIIAIILGATLLVGFGVALAAIGQWFAANADAMWNLVRWLVVIAGVIGLSLVGVWFAMPAIYRRWLSVGVWERESRRETLEALPEPGWHRIEGWRVADGHGLEGQELWLLGLILRLHARFRLGSDGKAGVGMTTLTDAYAKESGLSMRRGRGLRDELVKRGAIRSITINDKPAFRLAHPTVEAAVESMWPADALTVDWEAGQG